MTTNTQPSNCTHILHENGVHEFILANASIDSYEAYMQELAKIYATRQPDDPPVRTLFDSSKINLPISYSMKRGKELMDRFPNVGKIRTAILTDSVVEIRIVDSFVRLLRFSNTRLRFFDVSKRDEAVAWLLQED